MKKIITFCCFLVTGAAFFIVNGTLSSCDKQNTNCTAVVNVINSANQPVSGASVKLYAPHANAVVQGNGITNSDGTVSFTFTLPAIFDISVAKGIAPNDTLKGSGIIQLQIGSSVSATVTVK